MTAMVPVNDKWLRILLPAIPIALLLYPHIVFGPRISPGFFVALLTPVAVSEASRFLVYRSHHWFSGRYSKFNRTVVLFLAGVLSVAVILLLGDELRRLLGRRAFNTAPPPPVAAQIQVKGLNLRFNYVGLALIKACFFFPVLWAVFGGAYQAAKTRFAERQRDRFEREKLQAELQQLKGIVNPHFLFNNLNSLSALIAESPARAEAFLDELTKVFRYLLRTNNADLSTVAEELQFIQSYYHLLQTRYGPAIALDLCVADELTAYRLPPLTLQLLMENAVKHNRVQKDTPLQIEIFSKDNQVLVVRNNCSKREQVVESTGIGLHSINTRLRLLNQPELAIGRSDASFTVTIPLLLPLPSAQPLAQKAGTWALSS